MSDVLQLCWIGEFKGFNGLRFRCPDCGAFGFVAPVPLEEVSGPCLGCKREITLKPVEGHA